MLIEIEKRTQGQWMRSEIKSAAGGDAATADSVLDLLLGRDGGRSEYVVSKYASAERTTANRLNMLWVYPLFIAAAPFQWLFCGRIGVNRSSRIGAILDRLVKL